MENQEGIIELSKPEHKEAEQFEVVTFEPEAKDCDGEEHTTTAERGRSSSEHPKPLTEKSTHRVDSFSQAETAQDLSNDTDQDVMTRDGNGIFDAPDFCEADVKSLLSVNERLADEAEHLREQLEEQAGWRQELTEKLKTAEILVGTAREQAQHVAATSAKKPLANDSKVPDGELKTKFRQLKYNIRQLSKHMSEMISSNKFPSRESSVLFSQRLVDWPENQTERVKSKIWNSELRCRGIEKYLWLFVIRTVFESQSKAEADDTRRFLKQMKEMMSGVKLNDESAFESFCDYISVKWQLSADTHPRHVADLFRKDCEEVQEMTPKRRGNQRSNPRNSIEDDLRDILGLALELDDLRMSSKAFIKIVFPTMPIDEKGVLDEKRLDTLARVVEELGNVRHTRIEMFVNPYLLKRGTANGKNYDSKMVLMKADMVMG